MAKSTSSSQASQRDSKRSLLMDNTKYPFTDCPVPSTQDRNGRNRPRQVESPKLCLRPDMTLAGSKSRPQPHLIPSVPARTRASPRPGTPRRGIAAMSGRRAFQCIPSVRGRQRQSGAAKRLTRAAGSSPKEHHRRRHRGKSPLLSQRSLPEGWQRFERVKRQGPL